MGTRPSRYTSAREDTLRRAPRFGARRCPPLRRRVRRAESPRARRPTAVTSAPRWAPGETAASTASVSAWGRVATKGKRVESRSKRTMPSTCSPERASPRAAQRPLASLGHSGLSSAARYGCMHADRAGAQTGAGAPLPERAHRRRGATARPPAAYRPGRRRRRRCQSSAVPSGIARHPGTTRACPTRHPSPSTAAAPRAAIAAADRRRPSCAGTCRSPRDADR